MAYDKNELHLFAADIYEVLFGEPAQLLIIIN